jgi:hypothetical protein
MKAAADTLRIAAEAVCGERNQSYGSPADDFRTQGEMFSSYLSRTNKSKVVVTASDIAALMILVKVARQAHRPKADNWIDAAGYAACGSQCDSEI